MGEKVLVKPNPKPSTKSEGNQDNHTASVSASDNALLMLNLKKTPAILAGV
jgi:hypothetical protein